MEHSWRILVVDDEPLVSCVVCRMLEYIVRAAECSVAQSGQEALELIERGDLFDLIVTDIRMPGMTGIELHRRLKGKLTATRFLFMSGGMLMEEEIYVAKECVPLLRKPFRVSDLEAVL